MVSPASRQSSPLSGRKSTYPPVQICEASSVFGSGAPGGEAAPVDLKGLHAKIGELTLENDFLAGALTKAGMLSAKR
jgi:hypothetical protein